MLIISKGFTIFWLLGLCELEIPWYLWKQGSKQQALLSNECSSKVRGKAFLKWKSIDLSSKHLLHVRAMLTVIKVFTILFLFCLWEQGTPWQFSKQISKLSFQLSFQIYSLLAQTEGERETFFGRVQEGGPHCNIITWLI